MSRYRAKQVVAVITDMARPLLQNMVFGIEDDGG